MSDQVMDICFDEDMGLDEIADQCLACEESEVSEAVLCAVCGKYPRLHKNILCREVCQVHVMAAFRDCHETMP